MNYFIKESVVKKVEEKNTKKNNGVLIVLLVLALIIIAVMGFFTYKFYNEKNKGNREINGVTSDSKYFE